MALWPLSSFMFRRNVSQGSLDHPPPQPWRLLGPGCLGVVEQTADEQELPTEWAMWPAKGREQLARGNDDLATEPFEDGVEGDLDQRVVALGTDPQLGGGGMQQGQLLLAGGVQFKDR